MEDDSPEEFSFDSEPAIASETELPFEAIESEELMDETVIQDDSSEEFSFNDGSAIASERMSLQWMN